MSLAGDVNTERSADNGQPYEHVMTSAGPGGAGDRLVGVIPRIRAHAHRRLRASLLRREDVERLLLRGSDEGGGREEELDLQPPQRHLHARHSDRHPAPQRRGVSRARERGSSSRIIEAWEKQAGIKVAAGDAVFIRTGRWARRAKTGPWNAGVETAGLDPSVLPWLKRRDVSILGSETAQDATPPPATSELGPLALHDFALIVLGIHLMDDTNLEAVSEAAAARKRWEFLLTAAPLAGHERHRLSAQSDRGVLKTDPSKRRQPSSSSHSQSIVQVTRRQLMVRIARVGMYSRSVRC